MDLTESQWMLLEALLGKPVVCKDGRGRPWSDPRPRFRLRSDDIRHSPLSLDVITALPASAPRR
jgi:hypothetical protein